MHCHFKQCVGLCGKDYPKGTHKLDESVASHPHFKKYVKAGYIEIVKAPSDSLVSTQSIQTRGKDLLSTLKKRGANKKASVAEVVPDDGCEDKVPSNCQSEAECVEETVVVVEETITECDPEAEAECDDETKSTKRKRK